VTSIGIIFPSRTDRMPPESSRLGATLESSRSGPLAPTRSRGQEAGPAAARARARRAHWPALTVTPSRRAGVCPIGGPGSGPGLCTGGALRAEAAH
jgi:hypothetical protein